jgi:hypothetical protein
MEDYWQLHAWMRKSDRVDQGPSARQDFALVEGKPIFALCGQMDSEERECTGGNVDYNHHNTWRKAVS